MLINLFYFFHFHEINVTAFSFLWDPQTTMKKKYLLKLIE